ncbi:MAG: cytochrome c maturation protein CcmE [Bacteroidetes bacterium]|nr:cytochrome c maturation protein CcmE [Bacteroidota bacterium]MBS1776651.1 cytochrome c maturation protein CcmE [Bacteroidota bacterium]
MKRTHIVILVLVAVAVCVIVSMFGDFSTYETFSSAAKEPGKQYHVIGFLEKDKTMEYDPVKDPNHFSFYVKDKAGEVSKVIFNGAKPTDIEKSEQIVMTGYIDNGTFKCSKIQMKCPSKYKKDQVALGNAG